MLVGKSIEDEEESLGSHFLFTGLALGLATSGLGILCTFLALSPIQKDVRHIGSLCLCYDLEIMNIMLTT